MYDFILLSNGYPSKEKLYDNAFIHRRVIEYIHRGFEGIVLVIRPEHEKLNKYSYEGVTVYEVNHIKATQIIQKNQSSKLFIHFIDPYIMKSIRNANHCYEIYTWVHGTEALSWKRRLFNLRPNVKQILSFVKYIVVNQRQMKFMNRVINDNNLNMKFIFVSNWMKVILEQDAKVSIPSNKYTIIPNIVDENLFKFKEKDNNMRFKVLSIRPYTSRKYANDISVKVVKELSKKKYFSQFEFTFFGNGFMFEKILRPIMHFENVRINKCFLSQQEIVNQHEKHGIILAPTRQDAQGVSMCEAISSGLIPIVSNNSAIPEFTNDKFAYLCENVDDFVRAFDRIYEESDEFKQKSRIGSDFINEKCGTNVIMKELKFIGLGS